MSGKNLTSILLLLFSAFLTGCALDRPGMETDLEVRMWVPQWESTSTGTRALAPETQALRAELWQAGRLMVQAIGAPELGSDGKYYVIFTFNLVALGSYEFAAYALDLSRAAGAQDIQVARESLVLSAENLTRNLTLKLLPNENISSNVVSLIGGKGGPLVTIPSKQSRFFKLPLPLDGLWHIAAGGFSTDPELLWTLQDGKGNLLPTVAGIQPRPWKTLEGPLFLSLYNSSLSPKAGVEIYFDLVEGVGTLLDRRLLGTLKTQGESLLSEALGSLGTPGSLPLASATIAEQATLKAALVGADLLLPPNYSVTDGSIKTAETTLQSALAALEALRIPLVSPSGNAEAIIITPVDPFDPSGGLGILVNGTTPVLPLTLGKSTSPLLQVELLNSGVALTVQNWILNGLTQGNTTALYTLDPQNLIPGPYTLQVFFKDPAGLLYSQSFNFSVTQ